MEFLFLRVSIFWEVNVGVGFIEYWFVCDKQLLGFLTLEMGILELLNGWRQDLELEILGGRGRQGVSYTEPTLPEKQLFGLLALEIGILELLNVLRSGDSRGLSSTGGRKGCLL